MLTRYVPTWKKAPFIRFLCPLVIGIALEWYLQMPIRYIWCALSGACLLFPVPFFMSEFNRYKLAPIHGVAITIIFLCLGSSLTWYKDIRHDAGWFGKYYKTGDLIKVTILEPPVEKANSYKALASVTALKGRNEITSTQGEIIVYIKKDSSFALEYGSQIIFSNALQEIKNTGNPEGFNYKRYSLFQNVTHQVYLKQTDFAVLKEMKKSFFGKILFPIRKKVLAILRKYIHGQKEYGLAEALLIGYKDDLDKNLVQSYTNTGVVHIIAISGMHIALIYWLLAMLCKPLKKIKYSKWFVAAIIISGLWLFSLLAGAQASVLRSAVMFTCIVIGNSFSKKASIYNNLAASAFILLCYNPFWLWDVGFQLSYVAVLSIVIFTRPVYNWFYFKNKILDFTWKLNAVSIAAQLLTTPFSVYHFHQFPNFFLLTNFVAVPLSSIVVLGEIFLCIISFFPFLATFAGKILSGLIWVMNSYIERIEKLPYSLWEGIQINIFQAGSLIVIVAGFGYWFLEKQRRGAWLGLCALLFFVLLSSLSIYRTDQQKELIVYNIPRRQAIDLINRRDCFFIGDSDLLADDFLINFNVKPSRIFRHVQNIKYLPNFSFQGNFMEYGKKRILMIDTDLSFEPSKNRITIDLLVISKNPKLYILKLARTFAIKLVVFDASAAARKIKYWTRDCDSLNIPYYNVVDKGAFVMKMN
ncbi:MAG TPA: ComEC/Rec2 family competence protein [Chitinophagaceae bacterium]|nr:ComEC/Rec2 family competence protein [Chitinophagaceae bacterium]